MDLYEGETLKDYLGRERGTDYREAVAMASKILSALEVAHRAGIVHRDIQPSNIFLTTSGGLKLLDFGLAGGKAIALDSDATDKFAAFVERQPAWVCRKPKRGTRVHIAA